jgi:hypothetical protein
VTAHWGRQLVKWEHVEQRLMYLDAVGVADKAKLAEAVHEEGGTGARGANPAGNCAIHSIAVSSDVDRSAASHQESPIAQTLPVNASRVKIPCAPQCAKRK